MSLYESISSSIRANKDIMELIKQAEEIYRKVAPLKQETYVKILEQCPSIADDTNEDIFDFLKYLNDVAVMNNLYPKGLIETYLTSKDYKKKAKDFDKLLDLVMEFIAG